MTKEEALKFIAQSIKSDVDMAKVADAIEALLGDEVKEEYDYVNIGNGCYVRYYKPKTEATEREEAIKQCEDFIKYHSDWSVEIEWARGVEFVLEDYKRLIKQEPKISKEKAIEILKADNIAGYSVEDILNARDVAIKAIKQEPRKGHWIKTSLTQVSGGDFKRGFKCSHCNYVIVTNDFNFCPNCGADMREVEE